MTNRNHADDIAARVGARIESLRGERGLSLRKLAKIAECSITTVSFMESGLASVNVRTLQKIARALRVEPYDLLNHTPENDDMGYIVEKMRQDSRTRAKVKAKVAALGGRGRTTRMG